LKTGQVGWGLFRIRERLTLLGGRLDIDSAPGKGTRVRLVAPREAAPDTVDVANELSLSQTGAAVAVDDDRASPDALRILIVDDHPAIRRALREMLHRRPQFSVVGDAANGFEAIACAAWPCGPCHPHGCVDAAYGRCRRRRASAPSSPGIRILGVSMLARSETADAIEHAGGQ
jgi:hypothetical protein